MEKIYEYNENEIKEKVKIQVNLYAIDKSLCIKLLYDAGGYFLPFSSLSVHLDKTAPKGHIYVDINNIPAAEEFIIENNIGSFTGIRYKMYPLYKINFEVLENANNCSILNKIENTDYCEHCMYFNTKSFICQNKNSLHYKEDIRCDNTCSEIEI